MDLSSRRLSVVAALLPFVSGCYAFTTLGRARTVERKRLEVLVATGATGTGTLAGDPNIRPSFEIGARYGVTDALDLGVRVGDYGASLAARVQLHRSPSKSSGVDVLVAPGLAYTLEDKLAVELPLLVGFNFKGGHQLVLAPRVVYQMRFGVGDLDHPAQFWFAGASAGFVWQLTSHVALMPELGALVAFYSEPGFTSFTQAGPALQFALGLLWDP